MICSTIVEEEKSLKKLANKARKGDFGIDVINIGCPENTDKLKVFVEAVNKADNSRFL